MDNNIKEKLGMMAANIGHIKEDVREIKDILKNYATKVELTMVNDKVNLNQKIIFGFITLIVVMVINAILKRVIP